VLANSAFILSGHEKGLRKKQLAGIVAGCAVFIVVLILLGVTMLRRKKLEKPGTYTMVKLIVTLQLQMLFSYKI